MFTLCCSLLFASAAVFANLTGEMKPLDGGDEVIYTYSAKITEVDGGIRKAINQFADPSGKIVYSEEIESRGLEFVRIKVERSQTNESGTIEVRDGRLYFEHTADGKTKKADEKVDGTVIVSGMMQPFVREKWEQLLNGETLDFRLAVWDRRDTVGFSLSKEREEQMNGETVVIMLLKPSSRLIRMIVNPVELRFAKATRNLVFTKGRVPVMQKQGSSWKTMDARTFYKHTSP